MSDSEPVRALHSAEYFGESRDHWWNDDFLALMAQRLAFARVRDALDVGCGVGHWGRALLAHLPAPARLVGVDPEAEWVRRAAQRASERSPGRAVEYRVGTAERLPFADGSFDLVTCQTVLIHLPDVPAAIGEMLRVLRPGGLFLAAEPCNLANAAVGGSTAAARPVEERARLHRFQALCEAGKSRLGEGNNSVGDLVPGLLAAAGAADVRVYLSDKAYPMIPPYSDAAQRAQAAEAHDWAERDFWVWGREDTRRYFLAGGGAAAEFEGLWAAALAASKADAQAMRDGRYHTGGGAVTYLVSGRKAPR